MPVGVIGTLRVSLKELVRDGRSNESGTCEVNGDIYHEALAIETGAHLNGTVKREKDPLKNAAVGVLLEDANQTRSPQLAN